VAAWSATPSRRFSGSVGRAFQILGAFSVRRPALTVSEIADTVGLDRSTAYRFITTLLDIGVLAHDPATRRYRLGLALLDYGYVLLNTLEIRRIALSHLHELHRTLEGTLSLGVRDGRQVVLVERSFGPWVPAGGFELGQRLPMHASATGLAILAYLADGERAMLLDALPLEAVTGRTIRTRAALEARLAEIRAAGYASSDEELVAGLQSVAVPIRGPAGTALAAVSLARRTRSAAGLDRLRDEAAPRLTEVAERISTALGYRALALSD
jgi:IclR family pca regulon transcriptional regulator